MKKNLAPKTAATKKASPVKSKNIAPDKKKEAVKKGKELAAAAVEKVKNPTNHKKTPAKKVEKKTPVHKEPLSAQDKEILKGPTPPPTPKASDINPPSKKKKTPFKKSPAKSVTPPVEKPKAPPVVAETPVVPPVVTPPVIPPVPPVAPVPAPAPSPFAVGTVVLMDGVKPVKVFTAPPTVDGEYVIEPQPGTLWSISASRLSPAPKKKYEAKTEPSSAYNNPVRSTCEKPVAVVKALCYQMAGRPRKEVLAACYAAGVNMSTAATQYSIHRQPAPTTK